MRLIILKNHKLFFFFKKDEKLQRNDYLAQSSLELENNIRQDILSILVPKFVKDYINQG